MNLRQRIELVQAERNLLGEYSVEYHYMHKAVHPIACPFGWVVSFDGNLFQTDGKPSGFIVYNSVHFTRLRGEFGYPGLPTKWQVLLLSRLWLHDNLPHNSETCVIGKSIKMVQRRWLEVHPPPESHKDEPYHIVKVLSYCDTRYYNGTIYRAANFREQGRRYSRIRRMGRGERTKGEGSGADLICFVYDLKEPKWKL